jgi:hypothetical protein
LFFPSLLNYVSLALQRLYLAPLSERDEKANDMLDSFDFTQPSLPPLILKTHSCPLFSRTWWNLTHWNAHPTRLGLDKIQPAH